MTTYSKKLDVAAEWYRRRVEWMALPLVEADFSRLRQWSRWDHWRAAMVFGGLALLNAALAALNVAVILWAVAQIGD